MSVIISRNNPQTVLSLGECISAIGHEVTVWDRETKPIYDMLEEQKPDILFLEKNDIAEIVYEAIKEYKPTVVLHSAFLPPEMDDTDVVSLILYEATISEKIAANISENVPRLPFAPGANLIMTKQGSYDHRFETDVFYYANISPPYALAEDYLKIFHQFGIKCAGPTIIPFHNYMGVTNQKEKYTFFSSAKVSICDSLEDAYTAALCGSVPVLPRQQGVPEVFLTFREADELEEKIATNLQNEKLRRKNLKQAKRHAKENTYFDRLKALGEILDAGIDLDKVDEIKARFM